MSKHKVIAKEKKIKTVFKRNLFTNFLFSSQKKRNSKFQFKKGFIAHKNRSIHSVRIYRLMSFNHAEILSDRIDKFLFVFIGGTLPGDYQIQSVYIYLMLYLNKYTYLKVTVLYKKKTNFK